MKDLILKNLDIKPDYNLKLLEETINSVKNSFAIPEHLMGLNSFNYVPTTAIAPNTIVKINSY